MDARDFRGLGRPAQEALRRRALFLIEREGMTQGQAALAVGVHRQPVNVWQKRYRERGDDGGISNQDQTGRSWAPTGRTPAVARTAKRVTRSMIAAVSNRGLMRFMLYEGALNADLFLDFLRRLTKDAGRKVILIVDNLKVHKAGKVRAWVARHAHEIELVYLPSYAPDHNPSEYLNNELKQKLRQQPQPGSKEELIGRTRSV